MGGIEVIDVPMFQVPDTPESSHFYPHLAATASGVGARRFP